MAKKGHTEEQIIAALQQAEAGGKTTEICRKLGISGDSAEDDHRFRRKCGHYSGMIPVSNRSEATLVL